MKPDNEQLIASKYIKNHSLIIAGAGSGKTTTLLFKIDNLIKNGTKENEILVISFTNETVNSFKNKCKYSVDIFTFHKLAKNILNTSDEIIDDDVLKSIISSFLKHIPIKLKKRIYHIFKFGIFTIKKYNNMLNEDHSYAVVNFLYSLIKQIKTNMIDLNNTRINHLNKNEIIILYCVKHIIDIYNTELINNKLIDFDDLIINATSLINQGLKKLEIS